MRTSRPIRTYLTEQQIQQLKSKAKKDESNVAWLITAAVLEQYYDDLREADVAGDSK